MRQEHSIGMRLGGLIRVLLSDVKWIGQYSISPAREMLPERFRIEWVVLRMREKDELYKVRA